MKLCLPVGPRYRKRWATFGAALVMVPADQIEPPHEERLLRYGESLTASMRRGWSGRPLLAAPTKPHWYERGRLQALTGSHRIAAARRLGICIPVLVLEPDAVDLLRRSRVWSGKRKLFRPHALRAALLGQRVGAPSDRYGDLAEMAALGG